MTAIWKSVCRASRGLSFTLICLWGITMSANASDSEARLVVDGSTSWRVSVLPGASGPEALAAVELARYVKRISGADLSIVEESTPSVHVIRIDSDTGELDGFDLSVNSDRITIHGHTPRGALYGAYQLLEDMGCRWFYIGERGEVIPERNDIALPCRTDSQSASFRERSLVLGYPSYFDDLGLWADFLAKQRINNIFIHMSGSVDFFLDLWRPLYEKHKRALQDRQMILEWGGHNLPTFVPRELFEEHPDYFRMNADGQRTADYNFCPSSPALEILLENIRPAFEQLPEVTYMHFWPDDVQTGSWCNCPKCRHLSAQEQNMMVLNAVAGVLAEVNPDAWLPYSEYYFAPLEKVEPAPNLFLLHGARERCYRHAFDDPNCTRNREEYMKPWLQIRELFNRTSPQATHQFFFYTDGILDREMQPPQVDVIPADARYFRSMGVPVHQNLMVSFRMWRSPPFSLMNSCRAAWNADVDGWAVLADFCRQYYGPDLAEEMVDYYRRVEKACNLVFVSDAIPGVYIDMRSPPLDPAPRKAKIEDLNEACRAHEGLREKLVAALGRCADGMQAERVQRELDTCELHDHLLQMARCQFEGQFLGTQYLNGTVGPDEAQRGLVLLSQARAEVDSTNAWIERFPEGHNELIVGFQQYWNGYTTSFSHLEAQVRQKLEGERPAQKD